MASTGSGIGTYQLNYSPEFSSQTAAANNYAAAVPEQLAATSANWYGTGGQQLNADVSSNYQNAINSGFAANPYMGNLDTANSALGTAGNLYNSAASQYKTASTYDPTALNTYMNPYIQNVTDANTRLANQNLNENLLPQVNSTFTGAGQFGSSRNSEFANRALRDTQQALANTNATTLMNAQNQAQANYSDWANKGLTAAAGANAVGVNQANLGNLYGTLTTTGTNALTQNLNNALNAGNVQQTLAQANLDRNYKDWLAQQQFPLTGLQALGSYTGSASAGNQPNMYAPTTSMDNLTKLATVMQALGTGKISKDLTSQLSDWVTKLMNDSTSGASGNDTLSGGGGLDALTISNSGNTSNTSNTTGTSNTLPAGVNIDDPFGMNNTFTYDVPKDFATGGLIQMRNYGGY